MSALFRSPHDLGRELFGLCEIETTTGREGNLLRTLRPWLAELGAEVFEQEVTPGRHNVLATWGSPRVLLSTHLDTVPPFFAPSLTADALRGRGSCDAKGQIVAQLEAIRCRRERGLGDLAWLGVVGEETASDGADAASALAPKLSKLEAIVVGEPTGNRLAMSEPGIEKVTLRCRGEAAHSSQPERGKSALWPLLEWLDRLRQAARELEREGRIVSWNLGQLEGGVADNVIPALAEARLSARTRVVGAFLGAVRATAPPEGEVEAPAVTPPFQYPELPGWPAVQVTFRSDAARLSRLAPGATMVLCGPGDIAVAHRDDERLDLGELAEGAALLDALIEQLVGTEAEVGP